MSGSVHVHGFETSNNMKVRIGLTHKGIPFDFHTIEPGERGEIVRLSGQFLTPVLEHGDRVLFDSAAILRYLESNFPGTPRLFGSSVSEQWEIEDWELFARATLAGPMMEVVHRRVSGDPLDDQGMQRCTAEFGAAARKLQDRLQGKEWLVGEKLSAADVTAAPVIHRVRASELLPLPADFDFVLAWVDRVMALDPGA